MNKYNKTEKESNKCREQTSGYQWGEGKERERQGINKYKLLCVK